MLPCKITIHKNLILKISGEDHLTWAPAVTNLLTFQNENVSCSVATFKTWEITFPEILESKFGHLLNCYVTH